MAQAQADDMEAANLHQQVVQLRQQGRYAQAAALAERVLAFREKSQGPEHPSTGTYLNNLAMLYRDMGRYAQALPLFQRALAISEKTQGPDHPSTGIRLNNLALLYQDMGRYAEALPLFQRALAIQEIANGTEHPNTGIYLSNLAGLYHAMGQYAQALPLFQRALAIAEEAEGPYHPSTGTSLNNLAALYQAMGQYAEALPLFQRALAIREKALGPEHPDTGTSLNNLADLYQAMGQYAQALPLYQSALALWYRTLGPEHPDTGTSLNNLADLYRAMGQYAQALPLYQRALAIREKALGPEHPDTGTSLNNLAALYKAMGQYAEALPLFQRALAIMEKAGGPDHTSTGTSLNNLADLYRAMGQYAQALPLYQRALAIREKAHGPEHPSTGGCLNNLALLYQDMGRYAEALPLFQRALAITEKALGPEHPNTGTSLNNVARLYASKGQYDRALPLFTRALSVAERAAVPELAWTLQRNLMDLHAQRRSDAPALHQPALAIWYGKQAVNTLQTVRGRMSGLDVDLQKSFLAKNESTYQTLANLLIEAGRIAEAEQVLAMLKQRELGELVRSSAAEAAKAQVDLLGPERTAFTEQRRLVAEGVGEATELAALDKRARAGETLGAADAARQAELSQRAVTWREAMQRFRAELPQRFADRAQAGEQAALAKTAETKLGKQVAQDPAGAVGLHYVVTDDRVGIIVATPRGAFGRFSPVPRAELNRQIAALRQAIEARGNTRAPAQALWTMLIAPVQADLQAAGAKTLVLSLTDTLRYLPFAALQDAAGRYLIEDYALGHWAAAAADVQPGGTGNASWQVAALGLTQAREGFSPLPAVRQELQGIVRTAANPQGVLPGSIALDEQFSRAQWNQALNGPHNVMHVASHFDFKPGDESRSVLLLGQGEPISLGQLAVMDFSRLEQLTLSACETAKGGGVNENGAEVEGLAAVVLNQQARSVLATLWKVADDSTAQLMRDFYAQRAQATPPSRAQALRSAQLALLRGSAQAPAASAPKPPADRGANPIGPDGKPLAVAAPVPVDPNRPWAHPFYWAPFVLSGSWL